MNFQFRIGTWNLKWICSKEVTRSKRILAQMKSIRADIWILNETCKSFSPGADFNLIAHSDALDENTQDEKWWTAIWSSLPAEPVKINLASERMTAIRTTERYKILVIGTVLPHTGTEEFCRGLRDQSEEWR